MTDPIYTARLETEGGPRNLIITVNGRENDCNLGWDTDSDADIWLQIAHIWIAAPDLLAACEMALWEIKQQAETYEPGNFSKASLLARASQLEGVIAKARDAD